MNEKTDDEIKAERAEIVKHVTERFGEVEVIDSFIEKNAPDNANAGLWYLGKSLELLSIADGAYFTEGWRNYKGCKIEHECAVQYGIGIVGERLFMKYRKKPVVIKVFQYDGDLKGSDGQYYVPDWAVKAYKDGTMYYGELDGQPGELFIKTLDGVHHASVGDYIIQGVDGELHPCKPDIFEKTYGAVVD